VESLKQLIRDIPDFPKPGIVFKDITPILRDGTAFRQAVDSLAEKCAGKRIAAIACVESRGFIFGAPLAHKLGVGLIPIRKKGKLPYLTHQVTYELEYGVDTLEMHQDAVQSGEEILLVDDLLATGGTAKAVAELIEKAGGKIAGIVFLVELSFLEGRKRLQGYEVSSVIVF